VKKIELDVADEVEAHIQRIRHEFVDQIWRSLFFMALVAAPISALRAIVTGWLPFYTIHLALAVFVVAVFMFLKKMPFQLKSSLLLLLLWAIGLPGILTFGVVATSIWWLVLSCVVASIVISVRAGVLLAVTLGVSLGIAGFGFISGMLVYDMDITAYLTRPAAWIALMIASGIFMIIILQSIGTYNRSIVSLLQEIKTQHDQIQHIAMHDDLTGLPVRRLAEDRIRLAINGARRRQKVVALLFIDLNRFKTVNDIHGHEAGDFVLREVAKRLLGTIRSEDTAARIGGDEFLVILGDLADADAAVQSAERIIRNISLPMAYKTHSITVGASIGIGLFPDHAEEAEALLKIADEAMYSIKNSSKSGYAFGNIK